MRESQHTRTALLTHCLSVKEAEQSLKKDPSLSRYARSDNETQKLVFDNGKTLPCSSQTRAQHLETPYLRRAFTVVNLDAMHDNCVAVRQHLGNQQSLAAVIKADAYGHGALTSARYLSETRVVDAFVVALVEEGVELRRGGIIKSPILVMAGSFAGAYETVIAHALTPIVCNNHDLIAFSCIAKQMRQVVSLQLEVDVGMARLGFEKDDLDALKLIALQLDNIALTGLMAHPSHADNDSAHELEQQYHVLSTSLQRLESVMCTPVPTTLYDATGPVMQGQLDDRQRPIEHFSNSASVARHADGSTGNGQLVRVGMAMYGIQPTTRSKINGLTPVLSWYASVVAIRTVHNGDTVGYDGTWTATERTKVATVCIGYADGYPRSLSNKGYVLVHGHRARILGRVCMDYTMVDVTNVSDEVDIGTTVTLIGSEPGAPTASDVASWADTIPWEILARISKRVPRIHHSDRSRQGA